MDFMALKEAKETTNGSYFARLDEPKQRYSCVPETESYHFTQNYQTQTMLLLSQRKEKSHFSCWLSPNQVNQLGIILTPMGPAIPILKHDE